MLSVSSNLPMIRSSRQKRELPWNDTRLTHSSPGSLTSFEVLATKRRRRLEQEFRSCIGIFDQAEYMEEMQAHHRKLDEWANDVALARKLTEGYAGAIRNVIEEMQSLSQDGLIGSSISFEIGDDFLHAKPEVHTDEIVPKFRRKQLASGKLSETKMPVSQFNELYQDYVASVALRVAGDLFNIVPLREVYVTCLTRMLNPKTGHQELTPILSVQFARDTFLRLNLVDVDPSDSMANFNHAMSFAKTKGFTRTEPLRPIA